MRYSLKRIFFYENDINADVRFIFKNLFLSLFLAKMRFSKTKNKLKIDSAGEKSFLFLVDVLSISEA